MIAGTSSDRPTSQVGNVPTRIGARTVERAVLEERCDALGRLRVDDACLGPWLRRAAGLLDLTTLEGADSPGHVRALCLRARDPLGDGRSELRPYAVCVYPANVALAKAALADSGVRIASVAGGFPSGLVPWAAKRAEIEQALADGADELDVVIDRAAFLRGDFSRVFDEIAAFKAAAGSRLLKVILETGELGSYDNVRYASELAIAAGADFIKTSTGKITRGATLPVALVMLEAIRDHYYATGARVGFKPAGGVRTAAQALQYLVLVRETLGEEWLRPELLRIGASTLFDELLAALRRLEHTAP